MYNPSQILNTPIYDEDHEEERIMTCKSGDQRQHLRQNKLMRFTAKFDKETEEEFENISEVFDNRQLLIVNDLANFNVSAEQNFKEELRAGVGKQFAKKGTWQKRQSMLVAQTKVNKERKWVIDPHDRIIWDLFTMVVIFLAIVILPLDISFNINSDFFTYLNYATILIFTIDIFINFNTAYQYKGVTIQDRKLIAIQYLKLWFWIDLLSTFPFDLMFDWVTTGTSTDPTTTDEGAAPPSGPTLLLRILATMHKYCMLLYIACDTKCDGCSSPSGNCINCIASSFRINPPACTDCQTGYYAQTGNIVCQCIYYINCQECSSNCYNCVTSANQCTACWPSSYKAVDSNQKCSCISGYYEEINQCYQCNASCQSCSGPYYECNSCQQTCSKCSVGRCQGCNKGYYLNAFHQCQPFCGDQIVVGSEQCDDGNQNPFDGCFQCQYTCNEHCMVCANNICMNCQTGYYLSATNQCESICGDGIVSSQEQCDDSLLNQTFGCHNCQLICDSTCLVCSYGRCQSCLAGYYLNSLNQCQTICGDLIVLGQEKCDDGNSYPFDGCFQCQYTCNPHCNLCANNVCVNCQSGYYLSSINQCESICGDGIVAESEQCDDQILNQPFGCHNCLLVCDSNCLACSYGRCTSCSAGLIVNSLNQCSTNCGDSIVSGSEECDDGNQIPSDGCFNCKYDCPRNCQSCTLGQCHQCKVGYYNMNQKCESLCGDGFQASNEQCDDSNSYPFDGCFQCQYNCNAHCNLCANNICVNCQSGYYLSSINQCESICGDGIVTQQEECDDQILNQPFGCRNCLLVCDSNCLTCSYGRCTNCLAGFIVNSLNQCSTNCGDSIVSGSEECDDGNLMPLDGCFNCKYECISNCQTCILGQCHQCKFGYYNINSKCKSLCGDGILAIDEQCDDGNLNPFDGCFQCQQSCDDHCNVCAGNICISCEIGYELSSINQCESICGNGIVTFKEQCDNQQIGCHNCQLICDSSCLNCSYGQCRQCQLGYFLNTFNQCQTICGDKITLGSEQCDDGNIIPYDGCWNCQYDCPMNCQICSRGQCLQCNSGYYNQYSNKCNSLCGDGIVADNESCDDGNNIFSDGCYNCRLTCISNCQTCSYGICQKCETGYYLFNQQCYSICGDQIVTADEYCDDGNSQPFDGCAQCQKSCTEKCINCQFGFCQTCQSGYYAYNNECINFCGDTIIAGFEQCDDGNSDIYDGCYNCTIGCPYATFIQNTRCINNCGDGFLAHDFEYCDDGNRINNDGCSNCIIDKNYVCVNNVNSRSVCYLCPQNCNNCQLGKCYSCIDGYFLSKSHCIQCDEQCITCKQYPTSCIQFRFPNSSACDTKQGIYPNYTTLQCYSDCGDSIKAKSEECDDGNQLSGDGCNNQCQVETGWSCNNINPSYCTNFITPVLENSLQQSPNQIIQELLVQLSVPCSLFNGANTSLSIISSSKQLEISQSEQFNKTSLELQTISYLVQLQPQVNLKYLQLDISLPNNTFKTKEQLLSSNISNSIILFHLYYVSPTTQAVINQVNNCNNYLIYAIIAVCALSFLLGQLEPVLNMLDLMQYLSYLQYIDIDFPYILTSYFNIFNIVSMDLLIQNLGFTNLYEYPIVNTTHKFELYGVNAYFLANFQSSLYVLVTTYLIYFLLQFLKRIIYGRQNFVERQFYLKLQLQLMRLIAQSNNLHFSGLVQLILSSFYDLSFAILLFLKYGQFDIYLDYIYLQVALCIIAILFQILKQALIQSNRIKLYQDLKCLLEGLKTKKINIYVKGYAFYLLIKKTVFCILIVFLQGYGQIQTVLISMNSVLFICYFSYFKPLVNNSEHIKIVLTEIIICIGTLTFLSYTFFDDYEIIQIFQWIHVFSFTFSIFASLLIDLKQLLFKSCPILKNFFNNNKNQQEKHNNFSMNSQPEPVKHLYHKGTKQTIGLDK